MKKIKFNDEDVVMTEDESLYFYSEIKGEGIGVIRHATDKEEREYKKEFAYWEKQREEEQHEGSYYEISE